MNEVIGLTSGSNPTRAQLSNRQRPGRRFEPSAELALLATAKHAAAELPGAELGVLALTELHAPFGIPDLTVVVGPADDRRARLRLRVPALLNEIDAGISAVASERTGSSAEQISARLGWQLATVERRLPGLVKLGALREKESGRFSRPAALAPIGKVFAVEMKVGNWRRALVQCRTYRTWADSYVLIMDRVPPSSVAELVSGVRGDRGGLIVGERWLARPRISKLPLARRLWTSEHIIAACKRA